MPSTYRHVVRYVHRAKDSVEREKRSGIGGISFKRLTNDAYRHGYVKQQKRSLDA